MAKEGVPRSLNEDDEIALISGSIEEPKLTPEERKTRKREAEIQKIAVENEESRVNNITWIQQQMDQGIRGAAIVTTLREEGWSEEEILGMLTDVYEKRGEETEISPVQQQQPQQLQQANPAQPPEERPTRLDEKTLRYYASRMSGYRTIGIPDEDINKYFGERGLTPETIGEIFKLTNDMDTSRASRERQQHREIKKEKDAERKEQRAFGASIGQIETKRGLASKWQKDAAPTGRERPAAVPEDTRPLVQVETKKILNEIKDIDESEVRADQYMLSPRRVEFQNEINNLGHTPETASMAIANQELEQVETSSTEEVSKDMDESEIQTKKSPEPEAVPEEPKSEVIPVGDLRKERVFDENGAEYVDFRESPTAEGTPKEWKDKLRETIGWWASPEERLIRRREELDAEAEKIPGGERLFRAIGEKYNAMPFKYKLALGVSLGLGAALTAGTLAAALPLLGIAGQRTAGLASMYLKFEKNSHDEKWGKNEEWGKQKALLKAGAYTVLVGLTMKEAIELASQTDFAHAAQAKIESWLGAVRGYGASVIDTHAPAPVPEVPHPTADAPVVVPEVSHSTDTTPHSGTNKILEVPLKPEVPQTAAAAAAGGAPELAGIEVQATPGHGYEYMMKRLWEDLHAKGVELPANADTHSDIYKLFHADAATIDSVVHQIASDPKHGFFNPDGTSARIDLGSHMTIGVDGNIKLNDLVHAPAGAPVMPTETPVAPILETESISREVVKEVDLSSVHEAAPIAPIEQVVPKPEGYLVDSSGNNVTDAQGTPIRTGSYESPVVSHETLVINTFGLTIPTTEPHLYADGARSMFAYGGSEAERATMITDYLNKNPTSVIYAEDGHAHRVPWFRSLGGKGGIVQGPPMRTVGLRSLFSPLMKAPNPDEFQKIIK